MKKVFAAFLVFIMLGSAGVVGYMVYNDISPASVNITKLTRGFITESEAIAIAEDHIATEFGFNDFDSLKYSINAPHDNENNYFITFSYPDTNTAAYIIWMDGITGEVKLCNKCMSERE